MSLKTTWSCEVCLLSDRIGPVGGVRGARARTAARRGGDGRGDPLDARDHGLDAARVLPRTGQQELPFAAALPDGGQAGGHQPQQLRVAWVEADELQAAAGAFTV